MLNRSGHACSSVCHQQTQQVLWETQARQAAAPALEILRRLGCKVVGDVVGVDVERAGVEAELASSIVRLVRVVQAANRHVRPPAVRKQWDTRPRKGFNPDAPLTAHSSLVQPVKKKVSEELKNRLKQGGPLMEASIRDARARLAANPLHNDPRPSTAPMNHSASFRSVASKTSGSSRGAGNVL